MIVSIGLEQNSTHIFSSSLCRKGMHSMDLHEWFMKPNTILDYANIIFVTDIRNAFMPIYIPSDAWIDSTYVFQE